ncbi:hypothetical protein ACSYDW_00445 [Paeniglutamicibacter sp. R2-26]|uniref:hypothetical protein n=1 Tax=Paeniglutamicibacter sp. R2-26 TaxID=3144417 RepID=UPI003EE7FA25
MNKRESQAEPWRLEVGIWTGEHRDWAMRAAAAMRLFGADAEDVGLKLAEVRASILASGQTPSSLFGKPEAFGRNFGMRLRPPSDVLEKDLPFRSPVAGLQVMLLSLGAMLVALGLWIGIDDGWNGHSAQGQLVVLFPLTSASVGLGIWGWVLRTRGKLVEAGVTWAGVLAWTAGTIILVSTMPEDLIPAPPNWSIPLAGVGLFAAGIPLRPKTGQRMVDDSKWEDSRWFLHADNLLRGRYLFSRAQAEEALREAKAHRAHTGYAGAPATEFGSVEVFAAQLAAINPSAIRRSLLAKRVLMIVGLAWFAVFFVLARLLEEGLTWGSGLNIAVLVMASVIVARSWRRTRIAADARRLRQRRTAQARALSRNDD